MGRGDGRSDRLVCSSWVLRRSAALELRRNCGMGLVGSLLVGVPASFLGRPAPANLSARSLDRLSDLLSGSRPLRLLRLLRLLRVFNSARTIRKLAADKGDASTTSGLRLLVMTVFVFWLLAGF